MYYPLEATMKIEVTFSLRHAPGTLKHTIDVEDVNDNKAIRAKLNKALVDAKTQNSDGVQLKVKDILLIVAI
jgi:hypothetical protein